MKILLGHSLPKNESLLFKYGCRRSSQKLADDSTGDMLMLAQLHCCSCLSLNVAVLLISTARALLQMTQK